MDWAREDIVKVLVLVTGAIIFAALTFFAIIFVVNRPASPVADQVSFPRQVTVDGMVIVLDTNPEKAVILISSDTGIPPTNPEQAFTPTPVPEPTATLPPPTPTRASDIIFISYVVQPSDSLYSIAQSQNSSIELMAKHGIDAFDLVPGAVLNLPVANPAYCPGSQAYVVRDNDTVYSIAARFNTTPEAISQLNGLDANYTIYTTQVLCIPTG